MFLPFIYRKHFVKKQNGKKQPQTFKWKELLWSNLFCVSQFNKFKFKWSCIEMGMPYYFINLYTQIHAKYTRGVHNILFVFYKNFAYVCRICVCACILWLSIVQQLHSFLFFISLSIFMLLLLLILETNNPIYIIFESLLVERSRIHIHEYNWLYTNSDGNIIRNMRSVTPSFFFSMLYTDTNPFKYSVEWTLKNFSTIILAGCFCLIYAFFCFSICA